MDVIEPDTTATSVPGQRRPAAPSSVVPSSVVPSSVVPSAELVVVGVDGSPASARALVWAMRYAAQEELPLVVLTAWPLRHRVFVRELPGHFNDARWEAKEAQARVVAQALSLTGEPPAFDTDLVNATALDALLDRATVNAVVVVGGDDDAGALTGTLRSRARGQVLLVLADDDPSDT